jgi:sugar transferase (PEP-CTERM/EpsH1 system associated)
MPMQKKIRIMHVVLSMGYGGLERLISQFALHNGPTSPYELQICCLDRGGGFLDELAAMQIRYAILNRKPGVFDVSLLANLVRLLRAERIDIVHSHSGCSLYAALGGRLAGVRGVIHTDHGRLVPDRKGLMLEDRISSFLLNAYVAVSLELTNYLHDAVGIGQKKLVTILNGIDTGLFKPRSDVEIQFMKAELGLPADAEVIGTVCRLDPVKNLVYMIRTMQGLLHSRRRTFCLIAGDGPERGTIERAIAGVGLQRKIRLLGERHDVERIMPVLDVFMLPSLSEGTSMTLLEAMASGVPVVASNVGGNRTIVRHGRNGYLFPLAHPEQLVAAVRGLLDDKQTAKRLGAQARKIADADLSFTTMYDKYQGLYATLVS